MASICFRNLLKTVCFDCEMVLFLAKPTQSCVFWSKCCFFSGIPSKNSRFCQNSLTYRDSVMGIFRALGQKWPQISTTCLCRTQNTYGTLKGRCHVNLQDKINHHRNFSEFSETEAIKVRNVASFFQDTIHFHRGHLQPKTLIFTITALVE